MALFLVLEKGSVSAGCYMQPCVLANYRIFMPSAGCGIDGEREPITPAPSAASPWGNHNMHRHNRRRKEANMTMCSNANPLYHPAQLELRNNRTPPQRIDGGKWNWLRIILLIDFRVLSH